jgi:hypothetical protein
MLLVYSTTRERFGYGKGLDNAGYPNVWISSDILLRYNGGIGPFNSELVTVNKELISKWKIITPRLTTEYAGVTSEVVGIQKKGLKF